MPTNLLKTYNQLLELNCLTEHQRILSLKGVFNRDFVNNPDFSFRKKKLNPTPAEGEDTMERFFRHLTTVITDKATRQREYDPSRSVRLHWVRYHLEERKNDNMDEYYLLTAYYKIKLVIRWQRNGNGELRKTYKSKRRRASMACVLRFPFLN